MAGSPAASSRRIPEVSTSVQSTGGTMPPGPAGGTPASTSWPKKTCTSLYQPACCAASGFRNGVPNAGRSSVEPGSVMMWKSDEPGATGSRRTVGEVIADIRADCPPIEFQIEYLLYE